MTEKKTAYKSKDFVSECFKCRGPCTHKSGFCGECRTITCAKCSVRVSTQQAGAKYCGACAKAAKQALRRL